MTTKFNELRALMAAYDGNSRSPARLIDLKAALFDNAPALIAAVEAAQEVYKEWDADCEPWPPDYQRLGAALAKLGENDEQKI